MNFYFILWVIIHFYHYLFWCSNCPNLATRSPFKFLLTYSYHLQGLPCFLSQQMFLTQLIYFSPLSPESRNSFSLEIDFLHFWQVFLNYLFDNFFSFFCSHSLKFLLVRLLAFIWSCNFLFSIKSFMIEIIKLQKKKVERTVKPNPICPSPSTMINIYLLKKVYFREFPGGSVVRTQRFHCQGPGFSPW